MVEESSDEDKIRFDTGGTERMLLDDSGRLLIGQDSGDGFNSDSMLRLQRTGDRVFMQFKTDADQNSGILFGDVDDDVECAIEYEPANQALTLSTGNNAEAMRIDSSGNVGIGVTPENSNGTWRNLQFGGGNLAFRNGGANDAMVGTGYLFKTDNSEVYKNTEAVSRLFFNNNEMIFQQAASGTAGTSISWSERMRIDSTGFVGIGESNPSQAKLHITHNVSPTNGGVNDFSSGSNMNLVIENTASASYPRVLYKSASSSVAVVTNFEASKNVYWGEPSDSRTYYFRGGAVNISGALSKGSGSFKIDHPLESKKDTHHLVHSFVEGPQADNIYRGKVDLVAGSATINIDTEAGMTEGTFVALNTDVQCFTSNESNWDAVKGSVSGNVLTIESQNSESTATVSWMVIGERQDQHMLDTNWTDEHGKVILEPLKDTEEIV
jgi:hypothetical protein